MHADCFHDDLAFAGALFARRSVQNQASLLPAGTLADPVALAPLLVDYGRDNAAAEPRAVASQWSKYAFARLIIPTVVLQCSLDRAVDFSATPWHLTRHADGTPAAFLFEDDPLARPGTGQDFSSLIDDVMQPLTVALRRCGRLAPRIYASNAAMYFVWALDQLDAQGRGDVAVCAAARALTESPARPDGGANPFHAPHKALPPGALDGLGEPASECRRLCCVRDLDPAWALCSNCPRAVTQARPTATADPA